jgi:WW domain-containing adapter protein with coiled-coil
MNLSFYKRLARDGIPHADHLAKALDWNPDQPRDTDGKFGEGGGSGGGGGGGGSGSGGSGGTGSSSGGKTAEHHEKYAEKVAHGWRSLLASSKEKASAYRTAEAAHQREGNTSKAAEMRTKAEHHEKLDKEYEKSRQQLGSSRAFGNPKFGGRR